MDFLTVQRIALEYDLNQKWYHRFYVQLLNEFNSKSFDARWKVSINRKFFSIMYYSLENRAGCVSKFLFYSNTDKLVPFSFHSHKMDFRRISIFGYFPLHFHLIMPTKMNTWWAFFKIGSHDSQIKISTFERVNSKNTDWPVVIGIHCEYFTSLTHAFNNKPPQLFFTISLSVVLFNLYCHFGKWFWVCHFFQFGLIVVNLMAYHFRAPNNTIKQFTVVRCGWAKILLYYNMLIHGLSSALFFFLSPSWIWHKIQKDSCKRDTNCK